MFHLYKEALLAQEYDAWSALIIGEEDMEAGNFRYIKAPEKVVTKVQKLIYATEYIKSLQEKPDYVIRLDDDDLISKYILKDISTMDFDCFADRQHTFYDILSGKIAQQKRGWLANTVIHKFEHAFTSHGIEQYPLIVYDHSATWLPYYRDRSLKYASSSKPLYLRILSPTSITGKGNEGTAEQENNSGYNSYLQKFGEWKYRKQLYGFDHYFAPLRAISNRYLGRPAAEKKRSFFQRLFR